MKTATRSSVLRAYNRSARRIKDERLTSAATSAGFIIPDGQKRGEKEGVQVFVKVIRFSEKKLKRNFNSGGLAVKP